MEILLKHIRKELQKFFLNLEGIWATIKVITNKWKSFRNLEERSYGHPFETHNRFGL